MHKPKSLDIVKVSFFFPQSQETTHAEASSMFPCFQANVVFSGTALYITQKEKMSAGSQSTRGPFKVNFKCWSRLPPAPRGGRVPSRGALTPGRAEWKPRRESLPALLRGVLAAAGGSLSGPIRPNGSQVLKVSLSSQI